MSVTALQGSELAAGVKLLRQILEVIRQGNAELLLEQLRWRLPPQDFEVVKQFIELVRLVPQLKDVLAGVVKDITDALKYIKSFDARKKLEHALELLHEPGRRLVELGYWIERAEITPMVEVKIEEVKPAEEKPTVEKAEEERKSLEDLFEEVFRKLAEMYVRGKLKVARTQVHVPLEKILEMLPPWVKERYRVSEIEALLTKGRAKYVRIGRDKTGAKIVYIAKEYLEWKARPLEQTQVQEQKPAEQTAAFEIEKSKPSEELFKSSIKVPLEERVWKAIREILPELIARKYSYENIQERQSFWVRLDELYEQLPEELKQEIGGFDKFVELMTKIARSKSEDLYVQYNMLNKTYDLQIRGDLAREIKTVLLKEKKESPLEKLKAALLSEPILELSTVGFIPVEKLAETFSKVIGEIVSVRDVVRLAEHYGEKPVVYYDDILKKLVSTINLRRILDLVLENELLPHIREVVYSRGGTISLPELYSELKRRGILPKYTTLKAFALLILPRSIIRELEIVIPEEILKKAIPLGELVSNEELLAKIYISSRGVKILEHKETKKTELRPELVKKAVFEGLKALLRERGEEETAVNIPMPIYMVFEKAKELGILPKEVTFEEFLQKLKEILLPEHSIALGGERKVLFVEGKKIVYEVHPKYLSNEKMGAWVYFE